MLKHYLIVAIRNVRRYGVYSAINILGLAIALAFSILVVLFVKHEWSYNRFHKKADRIYRVIRTEMHEGNEKTYPLMPPNLAQMLMDEIPEIVDVARFQDGFTGIVQYGDKVFSEDILFGNASVFRVFTFPFSGGHAATALEDRHSAVITEKMARKYFGDEDPVGKRIAIRHSQWREVAQEFVIAGVVETIPSNSSIRFDFLLPIENIPANEEMQKFVQRHGTFFSFLSESLFVELSESAHIPDIKEKLDDIVMQHASLQIQERKMALSLQPFVEIYLSADDLSDFYRTRTLIAPPSNPLYAYILSGIALVLLVIACINFTNLSIGLATNRAREVGMRKVMGAYRTQLMKQFWGESAVLVFCAFVLSLMFAELSLPVFNAFTGKALELHIYRDGATLLILLGLVACVGFLAGAYPAAFLSRFHPITVLQNRLHIGGPKLLGRTLVVLQFVLSSFLIVCVIGMAKQQRLLFTKSLGFQQEHVIVISTQSLHAFEDAHRARILEVYKQRIADHASVAGATTTHIFAHPRSSPPSRMPDGNRKQLLNLEVDCDFLPVLGIDLLQGRNFSPDFPADARQSVILNESMVKLLELESPIGQSVALPRFILDNGKPVRIPNATVVGVVRDFHYASLHHPIEPLALFLRTRPGSDVLVRIRAENIQETLGLLRATWREVIDGVPFEFSFLDEEVQKQYRLEERWARIIGYASALAIFIACLGAFGLTTLSVRRRNREIAIRKIMGASAWRLVLLLSREFLLLMIAAICIAFPIAYYAMTLWLQSFAYRIALDPWIFIAGGCLSFLLVSLTVMIQTYLATSENPVAMLRNE